MKISLKKYEDSPADKKADKKQGFKEGSKAEKNADMKEVKAINKKKK